MPRKLLNNKMVIKKTKKETKIKSAGAESDNDFLSRIMKIKETAIKKAGEDSEIYTKEAEEAKGRGTFIAKEMAEIEECEKIVEEFKKNPPLLTVRTIAGITVERFYDPKIQSKIGLLSKHPMPFPHSTKSSSTEPILFETFGTAYIKRGAQKVILPGSSSKLPFIIRDGDIIGTENKSFVLKLSDKTNDYENDFWDIFIFPNSELKISIEEKVSHPELSYMEPSKVSETVKRASSLTVIVHRIDKVELLGGLFNIRVKKKGHDVNNLIRFSPSYPRIEFNQVGGLANAIVKEQIEKAVKALGAPYLSKVAGALGEIKSFENKKGSDEIGSIIELNKDGSIVIFNTANRISLAGSNIFTKKISSDINNPVKITVTHGGLYETDGIKNPDPRVTAIMKMWLNVSMYVSSLNIKNEIGFKSTGKSLNVEEAKKMAEYVKNLGDQDMEIVAKICLSNAVAEDQKQKSVKVAGEDFEGQKREALERLKYAEESDEPELIEIAKAQIKSIEMAGTLAVSGDYEGKALQMADNMLKKVSSSIELILPPYSSPASSDVV